ncbi:GNAT family N-acetyltransferase [Pacificoceanicola onchidii]|uniref:GNAT family N-acetyltransferase n=1 Tax=Pacificoceanicola onchidii TaxID=2562685 RepID=UPI0010A641EB|nr:GNAT family N-acetyltransferase [Pacificoceanicola onchidii]
MILTTHRLTLRPLHRSDVMPITAALDDISVSRWLLRVPSPYRPSDAHSFIRGVLSEKRAVWAICPKGQSPVGVIGLHGAFGYWLARGAWGHGYMTEAGRAVAAHHFSHSEDALRSDYFEGNSGSRGVLHKLGFRETGESETVTPVATGAPIRMIHMRLSRGMWQTPDNTPA